MVHRRCCCEEAHQEHHGAPPLWRERGWRAPCLMGNGVVGSQGINTLQHLNDTGFVNNRSPLTTTPDCQLQRSRVKELWKLDGGNSTGSYRMRRPEKEREEWEEHSKWKLWLLLAQYLCLHNCSPWAWERPGLQAFGEYSFEYGYDCYFKNSQQNT